MISEARSAAAAAAAAAGDSAGASNAAGSACAAAAPVVFDLHPKRPQRRGLQFPNGEVVSFNDVRSETLKACRANLADSVSSGSTLILELNIAHLPF
jgi:hypothetical protein